MVYYIEIRNFEQPPQGFWGAEGAINLELRRQIVFIFERRIRRLLAESAETNEYVSSTPDIAGL